MKDRPESKPGAEAFYVGIDVSKDKLAVYAGDLFEGEIENNRTAIGRMVRDLRRKADRGTIFRFALEETGFYSLDVHLALDRLGQGVCVLDPASVRHYAIACKVMAKTDRIDARVIRRYAEETACEPTPVPSPTRLALREAIRTRSLLVKFRVMAQTFDKIVSGTVCRTVLRDVDRFLAARILKVEQEMLCRVREDSRLNGVVECLAKLPGVGTLTATTVAVLAPELGSLGKRRSAGLVGLAPHPRESGRYKGQRKIGGGRSDLRRALYMPALVAIQHDETLTAFYTRLVVVREKKPMVALTAVMRKLFAHMDRVVARWNETASEPAS